MTTYRQMTCLSRLNLQKRDITSPADTCCDVPPGQTITLADIPGPGRIVRIWVTLPVWGRGPVLRDAVLRMFWDNEPQPSVECPLGDFFGASFGKPLRFVADSLSIAGGGYLCTFPMPFNQRAVIELENPSAKRLRLFIFQIGYYAEELPREEIRTFHAQWRRENPTVEGRPFVALEARGAGRLVGLKLEMQNRSWWLRPPLMQILLPRGLGLGMLEGPEQIVVDDEERPAVVGTGTEDFFLGGWYFKGGPFQTPTHGATVRSFLSGRVAAYRFFARDPIPFGTYLKVMFDHGIKNEIAADYTSVAYWYQTEPHASFPTLPDAEQRRPASPLKNLLQPLVAAALLAALIGIIAWLLW